ncbi:hypothetical protein GF314_02940 [bacterium]|nr:hypothetical protein [bacterium]
MKTLITLSLAVLLAGTAVAQGTNAMGMFFDSADFTSETTNVDIASGLQATGYIVLMNPAVDSIGGYELGVTLSDEASLVPLSVTGPNGWTNFGDNLNHLCGYQTPLEYSGSAAVLAQINFLFIGTATIEITYGASEPSSVDGAGPAIANGENPDDLIVCEYSTCPEFEGLVATVNGDGVELCDVVATETQSWSSVKSLF